MAVEAKSISTGFYFEYKETTQLYHLLLFDHGGRTNFRAYLQGNEG